MELGGAVEVEAKGGHRHELEEVISVLGNGGVIRVGILRGQMFLVLGNLMMCYNRVLIILIVIIMQRRR